MEDDLAEAKQEELREPGEEVAQPRDDILPHPLVGRPASTASAPHSAQRTKIAPMATHVMTAAGALKWRTRDVTATAPTVRASMQCVICLVMKTASTVMARIVSQASQLKNL